MWVVVNFGRKIAAVAGFCKRCKKLDEVNFEPRKTRPGNWVAKTDVTPKRHNILTEKEGTQITCSSCVDAPRDSLLQKSSGLITSTVARLLKAPVSNMLIRLLSASSWTCLSLSSSSLFLRSASACSSAVNTFSGS